jgi:hypothetical protein
MAISSTQITDYLYKKVGFGVTKTDTSTAKYPFNESIASPLLVPGATVLQQDFAIPNVASAPSANTVLNGSTIVSVYNTSTSAVVQGTSLSESVTNETWSTGLTNWIPPSFGSGYQLKVYAGPPGASAATAATYTQLPVAGSGNSDSWFFDYQSGILNFADTNVPTAAANVSNVVYFMGAVYTGTLGVTNYANLNVTGNLTSINGNLVLTNGNIYAQNYYGTFQGTIGGSTSIGLANVAYYDQITPLTTNQTFYLEFSNTASAGNSITGVVSTVNVNPSTSTINAVAFAGTSGTFTGVVTSNAVNAATIGNTGATFTGSSLNVSTVNATTSVTTNTLNAATIGNTGAAHVGSTVTVTGLVTAGTVNAATIGNTGAAITGATVSASTSVTTATVTAGTVNAATIGNTGAALSGASGTFTGVVTSNAVNAATIGNAGAALSGTSGTFTGVVTSNAVNAATIGNTGASITGSSLNVSTVNATTSVTTNTLNAATIGNTSAAFTGASLSLTGADNNGTQYTSGALQISGGAGISGNLYVQGNVYAGNLISTTTQILEVTDPLLYLNANTPSNYNYEVGFYSHFGAYGVNYQHTGFVRDHNVGIWKLFANVVEPAGGTVNFNNATWETLQIGNLIVANSSAATSTTTGALTIAGGAGIQGSLWAGNYYTTGSLYAPTVVAGTVNAATIGNTGAAVSGASGTFTGVVTSNALNAVTIGNAGSALSGTSGTFTGVVTAGTVNAATIGNTGASLTGSSLVVSTVNATSSVTTNILNAATIGNAGAALSGASGTFTGVVTSNAVNAATIGNTGASLNGATLNATSSVTTNTLNAATIGNTGASISGATVNATTSVTTATVTAGAVNAATIGNASAAVSGASGTFTGVVTSNAVNAATIGNTNSALSGATATLTGLVTAGTVNAATIGNVGAAINSATLNASTSITTNTVNAATIGNTGAAIIGATVNATTSVTTNTLNAATIGNTGASITGATVNATTSVTTATVNATTSVTTNTLNAATIGNTGAAINGATLNASTSVTTNTLNAATIGNTGATLTGATLTATTSVTTATVNAGTVNAATIGNVGASVTGNGGFLSNLIAANIGGTVATANVAYYDNVTTSSTNATYYVEFVPATTGNVAAYTNSAFSYNPGTGNLTASGFVGNGYYLTGISVSSLGLVPAANVAYYEQVSATSTNATYYPSFYNATSGNLAAFTNSSLNYNPSTGQLSATSFNGSGTSYIQTLQVNGTFTGCGTVAATSGASSTSTSTGALQVTGGAGITGNLYVGSTGVFGSVLNYIPANAPIQVGLNINNYSQVSIQNANNGNNASTDIAAVANNGSDNDTYVDMGIVGSGYSQAAYNLYNPNDGYLIVAGNTTTGGGNLILNTYQKNDIIFATGGTTKQFEVARITSGNTLVVKSTNTNSLTANTGALQVWGGASISGNVYHGASLTQVGGAQFNTGRSSAGTSGTSNYNALIMQGVNDSTLIYAKPLSAYDAVIIGGNAASTSFAQGAKLVVNSSDSMLLPVGTSAQRPGSSGGTDTTGMMRYSTTQGAIEWYNGTSWATASTSFTVISDQQFTGTGSQTAFTLTNATTTAGTIVSINGVIQIPTLAYSVFTGNSQLIFTEAPLTTDVIDVRTLTTTQTVNQLYDTSGYNTVNAITGTGVTFTTGTTQATTQYTINTSGAIASSVANVTIASAATPTTVDSFFGNTYSTAKYILSSTYNGVKEAAEALVVSNGATSNIVVYGTINTAGNTLTTWSTTMSGNIVNLVGTTTNAGTVIRMTKQYNAV